MSTYKMSSYKMLATIIMLVTFAIVLVSVTPNQVWGWSQSIYTVYVELEHPPYNLTHYARVDWGEETVDYLNIEGETIVMQICDPHQELKFLYKKGNYEAIIHVCFNGFTGCGYAKDSLGQICTNEWEEWR